MNNKPLIAHTSQELIDIRNQLVAQETSKIKDKDTTMVSRAKDFALNFVPNIFLDAKEEWFKNNENNIKETCTFTLKVCATPYGITYRCTNNLDYDFEKIGSDNRFNNLVLLEAQIYIEANQNNSADYKIESREYSEGNSYGEFVFSYTYIYKDSAEEKMHKKELELEAYEFLDKFLLPKFSGLTQKYFMSKEIPITFYLTSFGVIFTENRLRTMHFDDIFLNPSIKSGFYKISGEVIETAAEICKVSTRYKNISVTNYVPDPSTQVTVIDHLKSFTFTFKF